MRWFVDGMNVIGTRPDAWWKDRHAAMVRLVRLLELWAATSGEDVAQIQARTEALAQASMKIGEAMYKAQQGGGSGGGDAGGGSGAGSGPAGGGGGNEKVVDADFTEVNEDDRKAG